MSAILKFIRENHILALIEQAIVKKKSRLSLNAFEITDIPNLLYTCSDVEHLYLHKNKISRLSVQITQLTNLTILTLDYNNITSLPPEIGNLKNLTNLNLSYNPLKVLIPEIGELENLEALWCNRIELKEIPKEIGKLSKLDTFGARGNELKTIPEEMTNLDKLRWLTLENNVIEMLPEGMAKMISTVPEELDMSQLTFLEMIDIRDNPICESPHPIRKCQKKKATKEEILQRKGKQSESDMRRLKTILRKGKNLEKNALNHPFVRYTEEIPVRMTSQESSAPSNGRGATQGPPTPPEQPDHLAIGNRSAAPPHRRHGRAAFRFQFIFQWIAT
ncbi:Leucine-rich repeat protein SHOC-2 [Eumeta japonica]|uniref:Leucine-rich repeat protein SHOC-2 n=1 Tax=Eumeta variegata TaxID=151549 RepID=A0A4C1UIJ7_EUMVA|nr:Leucine-rich repeat protein SHOC-2 [Eumeta japonica]